MHLRLLFCRVVAALTLVVLLSGCAPAERAAATGTVPFSGTVTLDGKPLGGATLTLMPAVAGGDGLDAGGQTDESGKFELKSDAGRATGAKPGEYKVMISRLTKPDGTVVVPDGEKSPMMLMTEEQAKESVPAKYTDMMSTPLTVTIPAAGGTHDFALETK